MNTQVTVTPECQNCLFLDVYCEIRQAYIKDVKKREEFMKTCNKLDMFERIAKVDKAKINRVDRHKIIGTVLPFHYNLSHLYIPTETLKRVLSDKWDIIFPEFASNPDQSNFYKWALRLELVNKFCQLSENFGAHMVAAQVVANDYANLVGYASKLLDYQVSEVVEFYENVKNMDLNFFSKTMAYPPLEKQNGEARQILEDSCEFLKMDLEFISQEYIKFKDMYNSSKHGFRLLFPEDLYIEGESIVAGVAFFTRQASKNRGGIVNLMGFKSDDFSWIFEMIDEINYALFCLISNRRERYLVSQRYQKSCSVYLYFPLDLRDLYGKKQTEIEFVL